MYFKWRQIYYLSYLTHFVLEKYMFQKCSENQNTHFVFSNFI